MTVAGEPSALGLLAATIFSCQRRVAHFLMFLSGENLIVGTQSNLVFLRRLRAASLVLRKLNGCPSVKTMTTEGAVLRPSVNSAFAASKAKETSLVPFAKARPLSIVLVFFTS